MVKTAADFLNDLAERELVPGKILESLRHQVAAATKPVSAASIARLLVEKKHLTAAQAERLLGVTLGPAALTPVAALAPSASATTKRQPDPSLTETKPMEVDELGLAPLDDSPASTAQARQPAASSANALEPLELGPLDLMPLIDSPATSSPRSPAAKPGGPGRQPAPPTKTPAAPAKKPAAKALSPLEPLGLEPLATEPLGLEPLPLEALAPLAPKPKATPAARSSPARPAPASPLAPAAVAPVPPAAAPTPASGQPARSTASVGLWISLAAGGLVLLGVASGIAAWLLLPRDSGNERWQLAQQAYQEKQYAVAVEKYTALLKAQPHHPQADLARVRLGVARILAAQEAGEWSAALPVARDVLSEIDHEPQLAEVHAELAPLIAEMAEELVKQAAAASADQATQRLAAAQDALALANNGRYVPGNLRPWQRLAHAQESLAALERKLASAAALEKFAAAADKSLTAGDLKEFDTERDKLLAAFPEFADGGKLREVRARAAKAAAAGVQPVSELGKGVTQERPSPVAASLVFTHRPATAAPAPAGTFVARAGSSIWALDAASGKILWRRPVGSSAMIDPIRLPAGGVLLVDARRHELLCIDEQSGSLRWRHTLDRAIAGQPLPLNDKIFVATTSGRITSLSGANGDAIAASTLPTAACFGPATDSAGKRLYQLADRDYLYVLSADGLKCEAAVFVGHHAACTDVPPLVLSGRLVVAENRDVYSAVLHVMSLDEAGLPQGRMQEVEVPGHVLTPPVVLEQRLVVPTDRGTVVTLEHPEKSAEPTAKVAETNLETDGSWLCFGAAVGNRVCLADAGLKLFDFAPASGSLKAKWTACQDNVFHAPPQVAGDVLLAAGQSAASGGWIAAAVKAGDGKPLWETPLAVPLVEVSIAGGDAHVVSSAGAIVRVPLANVAGQNLLALSPLLGRDQPKPIAASFSVSGSSRLLVPAGQPRELILVDADDKSARSISIPDTLAGAPIALAGGLVLPCVGGAVYWLSAEGQLDDSPFQMSMRAGTRLEHCSGAAVGDSGDRVIISDGRGMLYLLAWRQSPKPQPQLVAKLQLDEPPISPVAALGEHVFVATRGGKLLSLSLPDLKPAGSEQLDAAAVEFGPQRAGDMLLMATDRQKLVGINSDGTIRWIVPVDGSVAGASVESDGSLIVTTEEGVLLRLAAASGQELARVDLEEPLRGAPLIVDGGVRVATADGVLLTVALSSKQEAAP